MREMERDITALPPVAATRRVRYGDDPSQFFDFFDAAADIARGAAVMLHGGFWRARYDLAHVSHACAALAAAGIPTASLEYRRVGNGGGWPASFGDIKAGFAAARKQLRDAPVVLGHSAGGHLALRLAAATSAMRGVVALAPVADLRMAYDLNLSNGAVVEFLSHTPEESPAVYDEACASKHASPVRRVLVHGTADDTVPITLSQSFLAQRRADPGAVELLEFEGGHFDVIDPASAAWKLVVQQVEKLL